MTSKQPTPTALGHIRVLDLSRVLAGPWAAQNLADMGAEVMKIENPVKGDDTRFWGPPFMANADGGTAREDAAYFAAANRNKRSVTIDFSTPEGAQIIRDLAAKSDVVIENFKVGGLKKYGLDYDSLRKINPKLVYCSITGFGQQGPYAQRPGYDFLIQGMGGLMSVTGEADGDPMKVGVAVVDLFTGMYASFSILAALAHRDKTGEGQHIDCSLLDTQVAMLANQASNWFVGGVAPTRMGNNHPNVVPYRVYPTQNGHVVITIGNDGQFQRMCTALGIDKMGSDARFSTNANRIENRDELDARLSEILSKLPRDEVLTILEMANVPGGPINDIEQVFADPQVQARGLAVPMQRPDGTTVPTVAFPARLSATPATYRSAPPAHGADTMDVLSSVLGMSEADLQRYREMKVI